jgi:hypothetical protein
MIFLGWPDFALWGEAIARAIEYKELEFINAYYDNIGRQNSEAKDNHPLGPGNLQIC